MKLSYVIEELFEEKGLEPKVLKQIVLEGMLAAYTKRYPDLELKADYSQDGNDIDIFVKKCVVSSVEDDMSQISVRKARGFKDGAAVDDELWVPFTEPIGRVDVLRAKQVIAQKIRTIEADAIFEEYKPKESEIVHGVIHRCERGGIVVKVQDTFAFLPRSLTIPGQQCVVGYSIRALLKEVLEEPRNENQLILDRVSPLFLRRLFELEIPEVFEKLVEVKDIVRSPGYKSKVVVASHDENIDPVGTCVGVGGARIKPILRELGAEKIDIISQTSSPEKLVCDALKPAVVNRVEIEDGRARVWVDDDQRSLAIGKRGQNISLASRLCGLEIELEKGGAAAESPFVDVENESDSGADEQEAGQ